MAAVPTTWTLFVYGSLMRGHENHVACCGGFREVRAATVRGRLYRQPSGYPMLVVPAAAVLASGTDDPRKDALTLRRLAAEAARRPVCVDEVAEGEWEPIAGELFTFDDAALRLPRLDALEDFRPGGGGLYERAVVALEGDDGALAWTYVAPDAGPPRGSERMGRKWEGRGN